ncbi:MAG TPA: glycoside hydrolase family 88 protein [Anaerolineae bacterium]|nr:glycoside hydrolase family 88 protein [Anaerolineae bacterium]
MNASSDALGHRPMATGKAWSVRMADAVMAQRELLSRRWHYEPGVALLALKQVWQETGEKRYFDFVKRNIDEFVQPDGSIRTYRLDEYNLDQINEGKLLFTLYDETGDERYKKAAHLLREQLRTHPRTSEGGFWHKQIYPHQMWLDGIYMASPFYVEFARRFEETAGLDDVVHQIILVEQHTRDPGTGLLYHGWDESKSQKWANPETGCSPSFWGRAIGWFAMAIPDVLDHLPEGHPLQDRMIEIFQTTMAAVARVQDPSSGVWYQVLDQGGRPGNYLESSASCMLVYAFAKGIRRGYLERGHIEVARRGFEGILEQFVTVDGDGLAHLDGICAVAGLGGTPYRDGSFEYYVGEKVIADEYKGVGPFIMASVEMEKFGQTNRARS